MGLHLYTMCVHFVLCAHLMPLPSSVAARLVSDRRGANMVEYVILVGMVALIAFSGFKYFGNNVRAKIDHQGDAVGSVNGVAQ